MEKGRTSGKDYLIMRNLVKDSDYARWNLRRDLTEEMETKRMQSLEEKHRNKEVIERLAYVKVSFWVI